MSNIYKIFTKILLNRLTKDEQRPRERQIFEKENATMKLKYVIGKANVYYRKLLYLCFIVYTKASLNSTKL